MTRSTLPGLELRLPPNTIITDHDGKVARRISITPVPLDRPPFPLPLGVQVPIYFTIQPGGAYIAVKNTTGPKGVRLIYPNAFHYKPGTPFDFWNYDADVKGWYIYGQGKVTRDGRQVEPDPGVVIYEFTGAMVGGTSNMPSQFGTGKPKTGDPVDLSSGLFVYTKTDLVLPDVTPIAFTRTYRPNDNVSRAFGIGFTHNYEMYIGGDAGTYSFIELAMPDGARIRFDRVAAAQGSSEMVFRHTATNTAFYGATISMNDQPGKLFGNWFLRMKDGTILVFPDSEHASLPAQAALAAILDRYGNEIKIDRDGNGLISKITSPNGRYIVFQYSGNRISQATDNTGRSVQYTYDGSGRLYQVTDAKGGVTTFTYNAQNQMLTIQDARQIVYLTNEYDAAGRVKKQTFIDQGTYQYTWTATSNTVSIPFRLGDTSGGTPTNQAGISRYCTTCSEGYLPLISQVDVTDPRGFVRRVVFGSTGYVTSDTFALGQPEQQTYTYTYYADNLLASTTDPLGRQTTYDYDVLGNLTTVTRLSGTPNAVTTNMTYDPNYAGIATITDPLNHTTHFNYDLAGHLTSIVDPL